VEEVEAILSDSNQALTRFANNAIHQNVAESSSHLSVRARIEGRTARASTNRLDPDAIRDVVEQAIAITRLTEPDEESLPMAEPAEYRAWTAGASLLRESRRTSGRAPWRKRSRRGIRGPDGGGNLFHRCHRVHLLNSRGVHAHYRETMARFSITAMADGSSGWAKASACDHRDLNPLDLALSAARKTAQSAAPRELPPGRHTVILEPAAVLDLVGQMFGDFSATAIRDGRSFLNDRIGKQIFGANITSTTMRGIRCNRARPSMAKAFRASADAGGKRRGPRDRLLPAGRGEWPEWRPRATDFPCPTSSARRRRTS
jgi:PmbA protein